MCNNNLCFIKVMVLISFVSGNEYNITEFTNQSSHFTETINYNVTNKALIIQHFINIYPIELWTNSGYFQIDYLKDINLHWLQYPPQSKISHYSLALGYIVIMMIGLSGNALVILLFLRAKCLRTPANVLVVNLAISDMLMMSKMPIFIYNSFYQGPALGKTACRLYGFIGGLSGTCSICTLTAISLDRYYVVKFPLNRCFTSLRSKACVLFAWLYSLAFSSIPLLDIGLGNYIPEGFLTSCSFDYLTDNAYTRNYILVFFVAAWVLPFCFITFSYITILNVVLDSRKLQKNDKIAESSRHMKREERRRQDIKLAAIVFLVIIMWFVAWTPYATVALIGIFGRGDLISPMSSMIPALFCKTASCFDPFVYALTHPRFKAELRAMFCKRIYERRNTARMWTTQSNINNERRMRRSMTEISLSADEELIEVNQRNKISRVPSRKIQEPLNDGKAIGVKDMELKNSMYRPSWWFRPTFSNRTSSVRGLARSWTRDRITKITDYEQNIQTTNSI